MRRRGVRKSGGGATGSPGTGTGLLLPAFPLLTMFCFRAGGRFGADSFRKGFSPRSSVVVILGFAALEDTIVD